jgi:hypothetical protein
MSLIKFPTQIKPSRITVQLMRVDETVASPLTNIQQVVSRGNPAWKWTYEFTNLSQSERDVVQAFLMNCRGALNTFKVSDPSVYSLRGSLSDWTDVFSGYGSFSDPAGSADLYVNSQFAHDNEYDAHITDEQTVRIDMRKNGTGAALKWAAHGGAAGLVNSVQQGNAYLLRTKFFVGEYGLSKIYAGPSVSSQYMLGESLTYVWSDGVMSTPVIADATSMYTVVELFAGTTLVGVHRGDFADYQCIPCALVVGSENLVTYNDNFGHSDWNKVNALVNSGWAAVSPFGVTSGSWKLSADPAQVNTRHYFYQTYTKTTSEDVYTWAVKAQADDLDRCRLLLTDGTAHSPTNYAYVDAWLSSGTIDAPVAGGVFYRPIGRIKDVGSGWLKISITSMVSSLNNVRPRISLIDASGNVQFTPSGSEGILVDDTQLTSHPFPGPTVTTTDTVIVASSTNITGSRIIVEGLEPGAKIKAGQRFELINRYHDDANDFYERSEFKRTTRECVVHRDGWAALEFDPPIRNAPVPQRRNTSANKPERIHPAVIFHNAEMKARLINGTIQYIEKPLRMTDVVFDVMEDLTE